MVLLKTVLRSKMENVKLAMESEHDRVADELNMEKEKKLKMEEHQVYGWSFRLSRNVYVAIALCFFFFFWWGMMDNII